ncbi:LPXTG cell wall anchor domain-containing protein [Streptococcus suis]|nr:LPXTG cell wall anchor domain-containing protein [Streptococcus suis]
MLLQLIQVQKTFEQAVTQQELEAKLGINVRSGVTVPTTDYTRKVVGYTPEGGEYKAVTDISQLPTSGNYTVKIETTNIYGQTIANNIAVYYNEQTDLITPVAPEADKPALIDNATVTSQADKDAVIDALKATNPNAFPEGTSFEVAPDGTVTVTYPDKSTDTVQVPIKQKDAAKYTPTATATPIDSLTAPGTVITPAEREAVKNAVALPEGVNGTVTVPEDASVQIGTGDNAGKSVVVATVTYPDGTSETVEVPVKQKDTAKFTAIVTDENTPAVITSSDAVGTSITDQADKDAITAKVTVPAVNGQKATITSKEVTSPVKEVEGKKVVEVTVTYADGTVDKVNVPVDQKDSEANNPTVKDPSKPALISVSATENTPVTTEADKKAITDKVNVEGLPNTPTSVVVPEGAKVTIVEDKPVVPVTVTYPDGTTDTINVPVKQADTAVFTATVTDETKPAVITSSDAVGTSITDQADKDAILAKVTVPAVDGQEAPIVSKEITSPVKEVDGKKVVEVTVTYADGTVDKVNVPVDQKDSEANDPTVKTPVEVKNPDQLTDNEKKAVEEAVRKDNELPDGTKVEVSDNGQVTITYPDGSKDSLPSTVTTTPAVDSDKDGFTDKEETAAGTDANNPVSTSTTGTSADRLDPTVETPVEVKNSDQLTDDEKKAVEETVRKDNDLPADTKVEVSDKGEVTITYPDGSKDSLPSTVTTSPAVPVTPTAPVAPGVTTTANGDVLITPPAENVTSLEITFTPEGSDSPVTVVATKDANGTWTVPADSGLVVNSDGTITIPADKVKDGSAVSIVAKNGQVASQEIASAVVPVQPTIPEVPVAPGVTTTANGDVLITPPAENVTSLEITFTPEGSDSPVTVVATKDANGIWIVPADSGLVVNPDGTITIPADKVKDGTAVSVVAKNGQVASSEVGSTVAPDNQPLPELPVVPEKPVVTIGEDGSVTVIPPVENVTSIEITFTPEGSDSPITVVVSKDANGNWTVPADSGLVVNPDGTITIPADKVKDGTEGQVTVVAKSGELISEDAVPQMPVAPGQPVVVTNGDGSVTLVPPAEHVTSLEITFTPEGNDSPITVTLVKDEAGNWIVPAGSGLVINPDGTITIPADLVKDGTAVSVVAKNGHLVSGQAGVAYVPETTVAPETPSETAPVAPGVTTTANGDVLITPPAEHVTSLEITFTPEGSDSPITIVVTKDTNGTWTVPADSGLVVNPDGTITIPADLVKDGSSVSVIAKNGQVPSGQAGTVLVTASSIADKITPVITDSVTVEDPANLTDAEKKAVEDAVRKDNNLPEGTKVEVAKDGTVTITYPDGSVDTISGTETVIVTKHGDGASNTLPTYDLSADEDKDGFTNEEELKQGSNPADPKSVPTGQTTAERLTPSIKETVDIKKPANLTDAEKKAVEDAVRKDNNLPEGTKVEVANDGTVTITYPDGSVDTISAIGNENLVNEVNTSATSSGTRTVLPGGSSARTSSKGTLPNTGEESSDALVAIGAAALLGLFALTAKRRRRED